jgi:hypothetical protein
MVELITSLRSPASASQPVLTIEPDPNGMGWYVSAHNLRSDLVASTGARRESILRVTVAHAGAADVDDLPDISGEREAVGGTVRFIPDFPFEPGVRYRAILDLGALGRLGVGDVLTHEFSFPRAAPGAEPEVSQVFPSSEVLPENLLRFHVRFSRPMQRGRAAANIAILAPDGIPASDVLYRAPLELWDTGMTCLTILLDPGRLKRGVGPNRMLGPPLKVGERYMLAVSPGMVDVQGRPLRQRFTKAFTVSEPVRAPIAIKNWGIVPPLAGSRDPLELTFPAPLDWAGLWRGITVACKGGEQISGRVGIDQDEMRWRFTPDVAWRAGLHSIRISPGLEDACGNTSNGAFDGPFRSAEQISLETAVRSVPFEVNSRPSRAPPVQQMGSSVGQLADMPNGRCSAQPSLNYF